MNESSHVHTVFTSEDPIEVFQLYMVNESPHLHTVLPVMTQ